MTFLAPRPAPVRAPGGTLFGVLGPVRARIHGRECQLGPPKQRAVLALLLLTPGQVVSTAHLISELWNEKPPTSAVATLQAYLSRVNRILTAACGGQNPGIALHRQAPGYRLQIPPESLDVQQFEALVAGGRRRLQNDPGQAQARIEQALALVEGPPLTDVVGLLGPATSAEAHRLGEMVLSARELHLAALLARGDGATAGGIAARLSSEHPLRESLAAWHILALYRNGQQAEALAAFQRTRHHLRAELGIDPGAALTRLHERLLNRDPGLDRASNIAPDVAALSSPVRTGNGPTPEDLPGPMIGRDAPFERLTSALTRARAGAGSVWLITGEAGIGKTMITQQLAARARAEGMAALPGRAHEIAGATPFWPWIQVLRELPSTERDGTIDVLLGRPAPGGWTSPSAPVHVYDTIASTVLAGAADGPVLVVLEDLQWADEPTLHTLALLAERCSGAPVMLVCTYRTGEAPDATSAIRELVARVTREPHVQRIELEPLDGAAVETVLRTRLTAEPGPDLVQQALHRSDGNPFLLTELIRVAQDAQADPGSAWRDVPHPVRDVLLYRLSLLPEPTRTALEAAAVVGREIGLHLLADIIRSSPLELDEVLAPAVRAGLVNEQQRPHPAIRFHHALLRETLYQELRPLRRVHLHARAGTTMRSSARDGDRLDEIAFHLAEGVGEVGVGVALPAVLAAADRAGERFALEHALALHERGLTLLRELPPGQERDLAERGLQRRRSVALIAVHGYAARASVSALARLRQLTDHRRPDQLTFGIAAGQCTGGRLDQAQLTGDEFLAHATNGGPDAAAWELIGRWTRGTVAMLHGNLELAGSELETALRLAVSMPPPFSPGPAVNLRGFLACVRALTERPDDVDHLIGEALRLCRAVNAPNRLARVLCFGAMAAAIGGRAERTGQWAGEAHTVARAHGFTQWQTVADLLLGWSATVDGDPRGLHRLRAAEAVYVASGNRMMHTMFAQLRAEAELTAGDPAAAWSVAAGAIAEAALTGERFWLARLRDTQARAGAGAPVTPTGSAASRPSRPAC